MPFALSQSSVLVDQLVLAVIVHGGTWESLQGSTGHGGRAAPTAAGRAPGGHRASQTSADTWMGEGTLLTTPLSSFPSLSSEVAAGKQLLLREVSQPY